ncbi:hypothetical protein FG476_04285 [Xylella fastidiosa subsp. multiplex]|uniref:Uncharacterized protein n=1 Tax=Xylella fastidiosa subsp. multiplex TaxID=644357 RepID=A0A9Q4MJ58_XYLFS|nr:hypothetical protein [Xylella fastidiosa subsp. multiplex]TNV88528.1 hypothetical protein C5H23_10245 [Xylella fastidiosa]MRT45632.1 hypothetical protein [Xylella fastidiosa subsp. multiplex]MRT52817.1 hypothetical protein [Xylella fastidiosa subsp. multiplex]MRT95829.1 hypothetical protein [Xylella fastidiosa subsp. multiplex]
MWIVIMLLVSGVGIRLLLFEKTSGYPQMGRVRARVMSSTKKCVFSQVRVFLGSNAYCMWM